ncbi:transposase [Chitinophaga sancti]|uniref:Transposase n=1 Tax=Chitinophaga sancti TaxID=1004 RepID=A0A1K1T0J6_9BACT|nr:transposase [Chitinophaga sancti]WQD59586.1 transposase [Chitinophaga sancti]WQG88280.1 transposase [Chitinophaga sancti]SFW90128.1 Transposase and inactivated derivatives [Chitinophaga sancti]
MNDYLQELLKEHQYDKKLKEEAIFRIFFGGEDVRDVQESLGIHDHCVIMNWVNTYRKRIEDGLISIPPMSKKQQQDLVALHQRIKELERSLKNANLMIL